MTTRLTTITLRLRSVDDRLLQLWNVPGETPTELTLPQILREHLAEVLCDHACDEGANFAEVIGFETHEIK